ncbi:MAG: hypothetical protein V4613_12485 [Bacteroidota bacterium]
MTTCNEKQKAALCSYMRICIFSLLCVLGGVKTGIGQTLNYRIIPTTTHKLYVGLEGTPVKMADSLKKNKALKFTINGHAHIFKKDSAYLMACDSGLVYGDTVTLRINQNKKGKLTLLEKRYYIASYVPKPLAALGNLKNYDGTVAVATGTTTNNYYTKAQILAADSLHVALYDPEFPYKNEFRILGYNLIVLSVGSMRETNVLENNIGPVQGIIIDSKSGDTVIIQNIRVQHIKSGTITSLSPLIFKVI